MDYLDIKKKKSMVLAKGTTVEDLKKYVQDLVAEKNQINPRKLGRKENATYVMPYGIAPLEEYGKSFNWEEGKFDKDDISSARDMGFILWDEIYCHGRCSIDELIKKKKGYDPRLIQIVINYMIGLGILKKYKEKDGTRTLEVISEEEKNKKSNRKSKNGMERDSKG